MKVLWALLKVAVALVLFIPVGLLMLGVIGTVLGLAFLLARVALIGLLASLEVRTDGAVEKVFAQGFEMGRPSLLHASADKAAGNVTATYVGGRCVPVMHGIVELN